MRALIISAAGFEDSELRVPYERLQQEDIHTDIASLTPGVIRGKHGHHVKANLGIEQVHPDTYDLLILPGGKAPTVLRKQHAVVAVVRHFFANAKPVAAIYHGPQILVSAGVLKDRIATCYKSVAGELQGAGAKYKDAEVVVDGNLITSRQPADRG